MSNRYVGVGEVAVPQYGASVEVHPPAAIQRQAAANNENRGGGAKIIHVNVGEIPQSYLDGALLGHPQNLDPHEYSPSPAATD